MYRKFVVLCTAILLSIQPVMAENEVLGFGFVNDVAVALRDEPDGDLIVRMEKDSCVWICGSTTADDGEVWYKVNTGKRRSGMGEILYSGWMMARFIDAGDGVWQDVQAVSADRNGMIVLKKDGSVVTAGQQALSRDGYAWVQMRNWAKEYEPAVQVSVMSNRGYCLLDGHGAFHSSDSGILNGMDGETLRLMEGRSDAMFGITVDNRLVNAANWEIKEQPWMAPQVLETVVMMTGNDEYLLLLTEEGDVLAYEYQNNLLGALPPDFEKWTEIRDMDTAWIHLGDYPAREPQLAYAAVRQDGTVLAYPEAIENATKGWTEIRQVEIGSHWVVGLREDGSCICAGLDGEAALDVSGWTEIMNVEAGLDFCVGVEKDGTLVFAGKFFGEK